MGKFWQCDDGKRFYVGVGELEELARDAALSYSVDLPDSYEVTLWERRRANMYVGPPVWEKPRYLGRVLVGDEQRVLRTAGAGHVMTSTHPDDKVHVWTA